MKKLIWLSILFLTGIAFVESNSRWGSPSFASTGPIFGWRPQCQSRSSVRRLRNQCSITRSFSWAQRFPSASAAMPMGPSRTSSSRTLQGSHSTARRKRPRGNGVSLGRDRGKRDTRICGSSSMRGTATRSSIVCLTTSKFPLFGFLPAAQQQARAFLQDERPVDGTSRDNCRNQWNLGCSNRSMGSLGVSGGTAAGAGDVRAEAVTRFQSFPINRTTATMK